MQQWASGDEIASKFSMTKPSERASEIKEEKVTAPIGGAPSFWATLVQDQSGRQLSLEEAVSRRTTLVFVLYHYGSLVARQAVGRILQQEKEEFIEHGLHVAIVGSGTPALMKNVFVKELLVKDKAANGAKPALSPRCFPHWFRLSDVLRPSWADYAAFP